jgi:hypothetical protein
MRKKRQKKKTSNTNTRRRAAHCSTPRALYEMCAMLSPIGGISVG